VVDGLRPARAVVVDEALPAAAAPLADGESGDRA
jgi:hypothetical protein